MNELILFPMFLIALIAILMTAMEYTFTQHVSKLYKHNVSRRAGAKNLLESNIVVQPNTVPATPVVSIDTCDPKGKTPYYDSTTKKCVQCIITNNCLLGFERCYQNKCIKKNSPQCAFYPIGVVGGNTETQ